MRNLVVAVAGDESLHKIWNEGTPNFDLFVVYYGDAEGRYKSDGIAYERCKGTKFNILADIEEKHRGLFKQYDAILVPDDDLYISCEDLNRFFSIFHQYELSLAQPSIIGWLSVWISGHDPNWLLRYVNWVEIMTPCFSQECFQKVKHTFRENRTNWGIDHWWVKLLDYSEDKIAVVDDIVAIHTRPCFHGDTYWRNDNTVDGAMEEIKKLAEKYDFKLDDHRVWGGIKRDMLEFHGRPSEGKFYPANCKSLKEAVTSLRKKRFKNFI